MRPILKYARLLANGRINKKKIITILLIAGSILLLILIIVVVAVVAIINAVLGQADSSSAPAASQNAANGLWQYVQSYINSLWQQLLANPFQLMNGEGN